MRFDGEIDGKLVGNNIRYSIRMYLNLYTFRLPHICRKKERNITVYIHSTLYRFNEESLFVVIEMYTPRGRSSRTVINVVSVHQLIRVWIILLILQLV